MFGGGPTEDPHAHLRNFEEIISTFRYNRVSPDAVRMMAFSFSLRDKAKWWLQSGDEGTFTTWEDLALGFITKFFPPSKNAKLRNEITSFKQDDGKGLGETWERYRDLLRRCPHHGISLWMQVQIFCNGLHLETKTMVDAAAGGSLSYKTPKEAQRMLNMMAPNYYQIVAVQPIQQDRRGVLNFDQTEPS
ncbi:hypothetical protein ACH5RR_018167 [Cinchona calisaya]|uniref:Retrotransposon gag domain-containing protein n=1 Tax=Cinchona calisaya TaxID=153742 RepID=A0ABD2ZL31_9GENT